MSSSKIALGWLLALFVPEPTTTTPLVVVLESSQDRPAVRALDCPSGRCVRYDVIEFTCPIQSTPTHTVIITGHSGIPTVLGQSPEAIADVVACFEPELLVLDTCYGFSLTLLDALASRGLTPLVVGPTYQLPPTGLLYSDDFFAEATASAADRALEVQTRAGDRLERWRLSPEALEGVQPEVNTWDPDALEANLQRVLPNLVRVPIPGSDAETLVQVEPARFRR